MGASRSQGSCLCFVHGICRGFGIMCCANFVRHQSHGVNGHRSRAAFDIKPHANLLSIAADTVAFTSLQASRIVFYWVWQETELNYCHVVYIGMRGIGKCPTTVYRLNNTVISVYRGILWRHQLYTICAKIQPCESFAVLSPIFFPITVC